MCDYCDYDGIVCFGGADWWYHNRGHFDIQMCRQLAEHTPVLYVNSIGARTPSIREGAMFFRRLRRKIRSWRRGFVQIDPSFAVVSPISVPGRLGAMLSHRILIQQVRRAMSRMAIHRPLLWIECPSAAAILDKLEPAALVYQRTDRYETFPGVDRRQIEAYDRNLKSRADLTLFCSTLLFQQESGECRAASFVDHGIDFERFGDPMDGMEPEDIRGIARPRIGFVGSIDCHTFDAELFLGAARRLRNTSFVLVGHCTLPNGWCREPNVHLLGQKPYETVASYMAACDVLIMPWNQNEWIEACNPVKLKEYLAVGRPVVSTPFEELKRYGELVAVATGVEGFSDAIEAAIRDPGDHGPRQQRVRGETWSVKATRVMQELSQRGIAADRAAGASARRLRSSPPVVSSSCP